METFFFITLGITFIFIILMVYHFRDRMICLEQKSDTMFEIINNVVKELTVLKQRVHQPLENHYPIHQIPISPFYNDLGVDHLENQEKVVIYEDDEDDDEEDEEDDDEDEEDVEDENPLESTPPVEDAKEKEKEELLKIIKLELNQGEEGETGEPEELEPSEDVTIVHKIDETVPLEERDFTNGGEDYRKLPIQQLKTMVITKGLSTDVHKLKRNQLIRLLENTTE